jgi:predicted nuclease with TOPRIM domain
LGGVKLEPELEDIKANIQSLKDTLDSTLKVNNILLAKLVNLTEENNNFQQQLLNKEVTKTYSLIEQQK